MAALSPASAAAIARLRSYVPPPTTWHSLPASRRAAVLILLFADKQGDLRVVLTMRASTLKSFAGQAALPGGKADSLSESPLRVARREAAEEIGLPEPRYSDSPSHKPTIPHLDEALFTPTAWSGPSADPALDAGLPTPEDDVTESPPTPDLPYPFEIEHLCQLPTNLAKTELGVRPVVAFLYATSSTDAKGQPVDVENALIPRLDAKEVAAVFNGPFHNFLRMHDELPVRMSLDGEKTADEEMEAGRRRNSGWEDVPAKGKKEQRKKEDVGTEWYEGSWSDWHESRWRMHNFYVPITGQTVAKPRRFQKAKAGDAAREASSSVYPQSAPGASTLPYRDYPATNEDPLEGLTRFRVFGMTARILVDAARVAYAEDPEFEHNSHFGDEGIIRKLIRVGKMGHERRKGDEFVGADVRRLLKMKPPAGKL